jgi:hypothetical protein
VTWHTPGRSRRRQRGSRATDTLFSQPPSTRTEPSARSGRHRKMSRLSEVRQSHQRRQLVRVSVCVVVVSGIAVVASGSASVRSAFGRGAETSPLAPVSSAIPGAISTLEPSSTGGAIIDVTVPASTGVPADPVGRTTADPSDLYKITAADTSWRVAIATDLISTRSADVVGYSFQGLAEPPPGTDSIALKGAAISRTGWSGTHPISPTPLTFRCWGR